MGLEIMSNLFVIYPKLISQDKTARNDCCTFHVFDDCIATPEVSNLFSALFNILFV